jgi:hypothetical protein
MVRSERESTNEIAGFGALKPAIPAVSYPSVSGKQIPDQSLRGLFTGDYTGNGDEIVVRISTQRHNDDPAFKPLFGNDMITLMLKGKENGDMVDFEGSALQLPGVAFRAVLTRIGD